MKKIVNRGIIVAALLIGAVTAKAQYAMRAFELNVVHNATTLVDEEDNSPGLRIVEFGIRYMPTFTSLDIRSYNGETIKGSATLQHGFGVTMGINASKHVGVEAELNYYKAYQKYTDASIDREVSIHYINIPVLLSLNTDKTSPVNVNFVIGPQFGINVGSSLKTSGSGNTGTLNAVVAAKRGDVGLAYGVGLEFALNSDHTCRLDLGYRGFYGLVDMDSSTGSDSYNVIVKASRKTQGLYVGLAFPF